MTDLMDGYKITSFLPWVSKNGWRVSFRLIRNRLLAEDETPI